MMVIMLSHVSVAGVHDDASVACCSYCNCSVRAQFSFCRKMTLLPWTRPRVQWGRQKLLVALVPAARGLLSPQARLFLRKIGELQSKVAVACTA